MRRIAPALALVVLALGPSAPAASASAALTWSAPGQVTGYEGVDGIACPSVSLCVAVDAAGGVFTSGDPRASHWAYADPAPGAIGLLGVSCPGVSLCVAVDAARGVEVSTNPAGGSAAWARTALVGTGGLTGVSCPSTSSCVAVDDAGDVVTSANPAGGVGAWHAVDVDGTTALLAISCGDPTFCVAADAAGRVLTSSNPAGGAAAWTAVSAGRTLTDLYCFGSSAWGACLAGDGAGDVATTENPGGGAAAWSARQLQPGRSMGAVTCGTSACVAGDSGGTLFDAVDPFNGSDWSATTPANSHAVSALACHAGDFCLAGEDDGSISVGVPASSGSAPPPPGPEGNVTYGSGGTYGDSSAPAGGPPGGPGVPAATTQPASGPFMTRLQVDIDQTLLLLWHDDPVEQILGDGRTTAPFSAPAAGTLRLRWYLSHKYWTGHGEPPAIAVGHVSASRRGNVDAPLALTPYGRRLLGATSARLKLIASGTFTSAKGVATRVRVAREVAPITDFCIGTPPGISCQPGIGRRTPGGRALGKVSHRGWPTITGVLWIVDHAGRSGAGTPRRDELLGGHGSDSLAGGGGADVLWGDEWPVHNTTRQHDVLDGGAGDDWIYASHGTNDIAGGPGDDTIWSVYAVVATIDAGPGNDRIVARRGRGTIDCGSGFDTVWLPRHAYRVRNCEVVRHSHPSPFARLR